MSNYKHPHDEFTIIDNTEERVESTQNSGSILMLPFISERGIDGVLRDHYDYKKFLTEHGVPNLKLHGQSLYHGLNWLENNGIVKGCRLTAKDAKYANILVSVVVKVQEEQKKDSNQNPLYTDALTGAETTIATGNTPLMVKTATTKVVTEAFDSLNEKDMDMEILIKSKYDDTDATTNGIKYPLYLIACKGRGAYGDSFRFRLNPNYSMDRDTVYRNYTFELLENNTGLKRLEIPLNVSTCPEAKNVGRTSEYISDVVKRNIFPIDIYTVEDYYYSITEMLLPVMKQSYPDIRAEEIDFIYLKDRAGKPYKYATRHAESVDLSTLEGVQLAKGNDGEFAMSNPDRLLSIYKRVEDFYNGLIDPAVLDVKSHPAQVALDANFPLEVKKTMIAWGNPRQDTTVFIDSGFINTALGAKTWRQNDLALTPYCASIRPINYMVFDKYNGRDIRVTDTYGLSVKLPQHYKKHQNSYHIPMAGIETPLDDIIIPNSIRPVLSETDKTEFYELRLNYIDKEDGKLVYATQQTAQMKTSDLTDINNVLTLFDIRRDLAGLGPIFRYRFNDDEDDIKDYNRIAKQRVAKFSNRCKFIDASVVRDRANRKKLNINLQVGFKSITEINNFTIEVNRY